MAELTRIQEGMTVYDIHGDKIGTVSFVQFSDEDPDRPGPETASVVVDDTPDDIVENIAEVFSGDHNLPESLRKRLLRHGYLRIDTGILSSDRFALLDQVVSVTDDEVHLTVESTELAKA